MIEDKVDETLHLVDSKIRDTTYCHQSHLKKNSVLEEVCKLVKHSWETDLASQQNNSKNGWINQ